MCESIGHRPLRGRCPKSRQTNRRKKESPHGLQDFVKQETSVIHPFVPPRGTDSM